MHLTLEWLLVWLFVISKVCAQIGGMNLIVGRVVQYLRSVSLLDCLKTSSELDDCSMLDNEVINYTCNLLLSYTITIVLGLECFIAQFD